jgi:hypothetical protein
MVEMAIGGMAIPKGLISNRAGVEKHVSVY